MPKPASGSGRGLIPSARTRTAMTKRLAAQAGRMTTAITAEMEARHPWYCELGPEERSWIAVVASNGIDGFIKWFAGDMDSQVGPAAVFNVAPRALTRKITLHQTVDLIRTTTEVVEAQIDLLMPRGDRPTLETAILRYSREIAFASAEVYAHAAELRVTWDTRVEAQVVDAIVRSDSHDELLSRASTLGWQTRSAVVVAIGGVPDGDLATLRRNADKLGLLAMAAVHGDRLVTVLSPVSPQSPTDEATTVEWLTRLAPYFGPGRIVVGPAVPGLSRASESARAAMSGSRSAAAWPEGPQVLTTRDLLPERVLAGNGRARRELVDSVYTPLAEAGGDLLVTCVSFLDHGGSVEATARALFVHPNTVRYRLKRIAEVAGHSPSIPRDAYVLRLALTIGRLRDA